MNLFFETESQAYVFIATLPLGFVLAVLIEAFSHAGAMRPFLDVLCLLACAVALIVLMLVFRDEGLRVYHLLALLIGAMLYLCGVGRLLAFITNKIRTLRNKNVQNVAGNKDATSKK